MKKITSLFILAGLFFTACKPKDSKEIDLGAPAAASFTKTNLGGDPNTFVFENTTPNAFITSWDFGGETSRQVKDTVFFARKGVYTVTLTTGSKGGVSTTSQTITIAETSPLAADFNYREIGKNTYEVEVTTPNPQGIVWSFSNGTGSVGQVKDTVYFPFAGDNPVTLSIQTINGPSSFTKPVEVATTDESNPDLNDPNLILLTGGYEDKDGKTWVIHTGPKLTNVGQSTNFTHSYHDYPGGLTGDPEFMQGIVDNEYTFIMDKYRYVPKNGNVTMGAQFSDIFFGTKFVDWNEPDPGKNGTYNPKKGKDPKHKAAPFVWKNNEWDYIVDKDKSHSIGSTIEIKNNSYIGWFSNHSKYIVMKLTADTLRLAHYTGDKAKDDPADFKNQNHRWFTFVPKK